MPAFKKGESHSCPNKFAGTDIFIKKNQAELVDDYIQLGQG